MTSLNNEQANVTVHIIDLYISMLKCDLKPLAAELNDMHSLDYPPNDPGDNPTLNNLMTIEWNLKCGLDENNLKEKIEKLEQIAGIFRGELSDGCS